MHLPALTPCPPTLTTLESLSQTQWCLIPACLGWTRLRNFLTTTPCSLQTGAISGHGDTGAWVSLGELVVSNLWFPLRSRLITPAIRPARLALPLPISLTRLPAVAALLSSRLCSSPCTMSFSTYGSSVSLFQLHVSPFCRLFWRLHLHFSRLSATMFCESPFPAFLPLKLLYGRNHMLVSGWCLCCIPRRLWPCALWMCLLAAALTSLRILWRRPVTSRNPAGSLLHAKKHILHSMGPLSLRSTAAISQPLIRQCMRPGPLTPSGFLLPGGHNGSLGV